MNKERLTLLADHLDKIPDEQFDMCTWCGTASCIAGHTVQLWPRVPSRPQLSLPLAARQALDLRYDEADWLFLAGWTDADQSLSRIDKHEAARAVRHLASGQPLKAFQA